MKKKISRKHKPLKWNEKQKKSTRRKDHSTYSIVDKHGRLVRRLRKKEFDQLAKEVEDENK